LGHTTWPPTAQVQQKLQAMFVEEGDYIVIKKEANMKVLQVTLNKYAFPLRRGSLPVTGSGSPDPH